MCQSQQSLKTLSSVISSNLPPAFKIAFKISEMERRWQEVVGTRLFSHTNPVSIDRSGLVVVCDSPASAQMFKMGAATYLHRIEEKFGVRFQGIRVVISKVERRRRAVKRRARPLNVSKKMVEEALSYITTKVKDEKLAMAIAKAQAAAQTLYGKGKN